MTIRITAGIWRGRLLKTPRENVRPTQDRVRLAVFSSLADRVPGARVLDLFAGTGSYGLESLSRAAAAVVWVENNRRVLPVLRANVAGLCGRGCAAHIVFDDVLRFLQHGAAAAPYDLIFADPPYRAGAWLKKILNALAGRTILKKSGVLVMEQSAHAPEDAVAGWQRLKRRVYGATLIDYFAPLEDL